MPDVSELGWVCRVCGGEKIERFGQSTLDCSQRVLAVELSNGDLVMTRAGAIDRNEALAYDAWYGYRCVDCQAEGRKLADLLVDPLKVAAICECGHPRAEHVELGFSAEYFPHLRRGLIACQECPCEDFKARLPVVPDPPPGQLALDALALGGDARG